MATIFCCRRPFLPITVPSPWNSGVGEVNRFIRDHSYLVTKSPRSVVDGISSSVDTWHIDLTSPLCRLLQYGQSPSSDPAAALNHNELRGEMCRKHERITARRQQPRRHPGSGQRRRNIGRWYDPWLGMSAAKPATILVRRLSIGGRRAACGSCRQVTCRRRRDGTDSVAARSQPRRLSSNDEDQRSRTNLPDRRRGKTCRTLTRPRWSSLHGSAQMKRSR